MNPVKPLYIVYLLLLTSCTMIKVDVDYDNQIDFSHLANYAWLSTKIPVTGNSIIDSDTLLHDRIHKKIDHWFLSHGYIKTKPGKADFLLIYRMIMENKTRLTVLDPYYNYPYSWNYGYGGYYFPYFAWSYYPEIRTYEYQRGTLVLDIINPKNKKLMWRGMAYQDMSINTSQKKKAQAVSQAIKSILSRFPPKK